MPPNKIMSQRLGKAVFVSGMALATLASACAESDERHILNNNPDELADRIITKRETIALTPTGTSTVMPVYEFIAEVRAPTTTTGVDLRATHVLRKGAHTLVSYNREGPGYFGGIEVIETINPHTPRVVSSLLFVDTDFSALTYDPATLDIYATGAREPSGAGFSTPAVLEAMPYNAQTGQFMGGSTSIDLPSWVGTGVAHSMGRMFVSVGNAFNRGETGGLFAVGLTGANQNQVMESYRYNNALGVSADNQGNLAVVRGGPAARMHVYQATNNGSSGGAERDIGTIIPANGKGELDVENGLVWVAQGEEGVKAYELTGTSTTPRYIINRPTVPPGGHAPDYISNAVALDGRFIYVAAGAAGLQIVMLPSNPGPGTITLHPVAAWEFGSSANYVSADGILVYVASGTGGLKILERQHPLN